MRKLTFRIALTILGIMMIAFTRFKMTTNENEVKIDSVKNSKEKMLLVKWSPFVGLVLIIGGMMIFVRAKSKLAKSQR